ncbi:S-adenosyl-L-methionine-dependent methyltransferase, partial [Colletotrichum falcatum]
RVLDIGTGTGLWAMKYADEYSEDVIVTGVDIRPIQPEWVPPNCVFEIFNCEERWTWKSKFHYIRMANLAGCLNDVQGVMNQAYEHLQPGGILQMVDFDLCLKCDDEVGLQHSPAYNFFQKHIKAAQRLKRPIHIVGQYQDMMKAAGYQLLRHNVFKVPINEWPLDTQEKELGSLMKAFITSDPIGMFVDRLVSGSDVEPQQAILDCIMMRQELMETKNRFYFTA